MKLVKTGRIFNLALRVSDGQRTSTAQQESLSWRINWNVVLPNDIPANQNFEVTHSFTEAISGAYMSNVADQFLSAKRGHTLFSNLATDSKCSSYFIDTNTSQMVYYPRYLNNITMKNFSGGTFTFTGGVGWRLTGGYSADPRIFYCSSPEAHSSISVHYQELQSYVPALVDLNTTPANFWANANPITNAFFDGNLLPMFYSIDLNNANPPVLDLGPPQGVHEFKFELLERK